MDRIQELKRHWNAELKKSYFKERGLPPKTKARTKSFLPDISYCKDEGVITIDLFPIGIDKILKKEGVFFTDQKGVTVRGDYFTPDDQIGGATVMDQVHDYIMAHIGEFEVVEP